MSECWRVISGYEGLYEVSNLGNIRSIRGGEVKLKTPRLRKNGYYDVQLFKNGVDKRYLIHRLVAIAFIPNQNNLPQVNHKDECKSNNDVNNLEWCTRKYNQRYSHGKTVLQYDMNGVLIKEWSSVRETEEFGFNHGAIYKCCNGVYTHHKGYRWKYGN